MTTLKALRAVGLAAALLAGGFAAAPTAQAATADIYSTPGDHYVNGRYWRTTCESYSSTVVRCRTEIYATKVAKSGGQYVTHNAWVFNNQTYLPSARGAWRGNPLATTGQWTSSDGRAWKTECDTAATGRNACRSYIWTAVVTPVNGRFVVKDAWVFNNIVRFSGAGVAPITTVPTGGQKIPGMPVDQPIPKPPAPATNTGTSFRLDSRCMTGRAFCASKSQRKMAWVVDGRIIKVVDVRFGASSTPTRNGAWKIFWKSRDHVSGEYGSAMPFAMFFSGGQAIHYSSDFAARGYNGASHGCINVRDKAGIRWLFDQARVGDKVIVYN